MEALYNINLKIDREYINIFEQLLKVIFSYGFLFLIEGNIKPDILSLLIYSIIGNLFYYLVFKKIILFE